MTPTVEMTIANAEIVELKRILEFHLEVGKLTKQMIEYVMEIRIETILQASPIKVKLWIDDFGNFSQQSLNEIVLLLETGKMMQQQTMVTITEKNGIPDPAANYASPLVKAASTFSNERPVDNHLVQKSFSELGEDSVSIIITRTSTGNWPFLARLVRSFLEETKKSVQRQDSNPSQEDTEE